MVDLPWARNIRPASTLVFALMVTTLIALIIPAIRTLDIIKIEIIKEAE